MTAPVTVVQIQPEYEDYRDKINNALNNLYNQSATFAQLWDYFRTHSDKGFALVIGNYFDRATGNVIPSAFLRNGMDYFDTFSGTYPPSQYFGVLHINFDQINGDYAQGQPGYRFSFESIFVHEFAHIMQQLLAGNFNEGNIDGRELDAINAENDILNEIYGDSLKDRELIYDRHKGSVDRDDYAPIFLNPLPPGPLPPARPPISEGEAKKTVGVDDEGGAKNPYP